RDWSSDVCSSDLKKIRIAFVQAHRLLRFIKCAVAIYYQTHVLSHLIDPIQDRIFFKSNSHTYLICPSPVTNHFSVTNFSKANGPRACNFCVEMPISAPKPNSPPSVNRVDALEYTAAASTAFIKFRIFSESEETIHSECLEE